MKKYLIPFLLLSIGFSDTTYVGGSVNGNWSTSNSPIVVTDNLIILPGDSLMIEPGTEILFNGVYKIDVFGWFQAIGTESNPILFHSNSGQWASINFADDSSDSSRVSHCIIRNASSSGYDPYHGALNCNYSSPKIDNNVFEQIGSSALYLTESNANITNNKFYLYSNKTRYISFVGGSPKVLHNEFMGIDFSYKDFNELVFVSNANDVEIIGNHIHNFEMNIYAGYDPVFFNLQSNSNIDFSQNTIENISAGSLRILFSSSSTNMTFSENIIQNLNSYSNNGQPTFRFVSLNGGEIKDNIIRDFQMTEGQYVNVFHIDSNSPGHSNIFFKRNIIQEVHSNYWNWNQVYSSLLMLEHRNSIYIHGNLFSDNTVLSAIYNGNQSSSDTYIFNNTINNNSISTGILCSGYNGYNFYLNNSITNNKRGIQFNGNNFDVRNNNVWNNSDYNYTSGGPSNIGDLVNINLNGIVCDIYENISVDPLYKNPNINNYNLQSNSPNINAGCPDTLSTSADYLAFDSDSSLVIPYIHTYDANGTIIDMGAFHFVPSPTLVLNHNLNAIADNMDIYTNPIDIGENMTDTLKIVNNGDSLLTWSANSDSSWLTLVPSSGSVAPGDTMDFIINGQVSTFDAGDYVTEIHFSSNDPYSELLSFNIQLSIRSVWQVSISAQAGDLIDSDNIFGMNQTATDDQDELFDFPEPPSPPNDYLQLTFYNPNWDETIQHYRTDIRAHRDLYGNDVEIWNMVIDSDTDEETAALSFSASTNFPEGYSYWLISAENDTTDVTSSTDIAINLDDGDASFSIMVKGIVPDAPVVTFTDPSIGSFFRTGESIDLAWSLQNEALYYDLYYSSNGGETFSLVEENIHGDVRTYSWAIPNNLLNTELYFRMDAYGPGDTFSQTSIGPLASIPYSISMDLTPGWNMFGLPLSGSNVSINMDNYYLFSFHNEEGYNSLTLDEFESGSGYWAAIFEQATLTAESTSELDTIEINLNSGWNLINSSMPFDVDFELLSVVTTEDTLSFADGVSNGYITSPSSFYWDGSVYRVTDSLLTNKGSWISANSNISLLVPPEFHVQSTQRSTGRTASRDENNWALPISIQNDQSSDFLTSLGVKVDANPGFDVAYDMPTPPSPPSGSVLRGYFSHPDWNIITGSMFSTDYVSPIGEGSEHVWNLMIDGNVEGPIEVSWESINELLPDNYQVYLDHNGETIDMNETSSINLSASDLPIELDIIVQSLTLSLGHEQLPTKFGISQNYPNPFNPTTTLKYQLPEFSVVNISIYDMLGNLVKTLVNTSESPGYKSVQWNATNNQGEPVSAGVYLYSIEAGDFRQTKKMILLK